MVVYARLDEREWWKTLRVRSEIAERTWVWMESRGTSGRSLLLRVGLKKKDQEIISLPSCQGRYSIK